MIKIKEANRGTRIEIADVDFIETDNNGAINITLKKGTTYVVPVAMALVFQGSQIVIG